MDVQAIFALVSADVLILSVCAVALSLVALRVNVAIPAAMVLALFLSNALQPLLIQTVGVAGTLGSTANIASFSVCAAVLFVIFLRLLTRHFHEEATFTGAILAGGAGTIGVLAAWVSNPFLQSVHAFGSPFTTWITTASVLLWIFASLIVLGFAQRQSRWI